MSENKKTVLKQKLEAAENKVAELSSLIEVSKIITSTLDLDELLALIMKAVEKVMEKFIPARLIISVAVHILAKQRDFFITRRRQSFALLLDILRWARDLFTASVGNNAVGAILIAAAND